MFTKNQSSTNRLFKAVLLGSLSLFTSLHGNETFAAVVGDFDPTPDTGTSETSYPEWRYKRANFSVDNKSVMGANAVSLDKTKFLGIDWDSKEFTKKVDWGKKTLQGFMAGEIHAGRLGLEAQARASGGEVDIDYDASVGFKYDQNVTRGEDLAIKTKWASLTGSRMDATGVDLSFQLDLVTDYKVTYGVGLDTGLTKTWTTDSSKGDNGDRRFDQDDWDDGSLFDRHRRDKTLLSAGGDGRTTLFAFGPGKTRQDFEFDTYIDGYLQIPDITSGSDRHSKNYEKDLSLTMRSDPFVNMEFDPVKLLAKALPALEALEGELDFGVMEIDYTLFSSKLAASAMIEQTFTLDVHGVDIMLREKNGYLPTVEGRAGDTFEFNKPIIHNAGLNAPDEVELDFTAIMELDHTFHATTDLVITLDMILKALSVSATYDVFVNEGRLFDFGPALNLEEELAEFRINLMNKEFKISGLGKEYHHFTMMTNVVNVSGVPATLPEPASMALMLFGMCLLGRRSL